MIHASTVTDQLKNANYFVSFWSVAVCGAVGIVGIRLTRNRDAPIIFCLKFSISGTIVFSGNAVAADSDLLKDTAFVTEDKSNVFDSGGGETLSGISHSPAAINTTAAHAAAHVFRCSEESAKRQTIPAPDLPGCPVSI